MSEGSKSGRARNLRRSPSATERNRMTNRLESRLAADRLVGRMCGQSPPAAGVIPPATSMMDRWRTRRKQARARARPAVRPLWRLQSKYALRRPGS